MSEPDRVHVAMMNLLWPRAGLEVGTFHDYWSGAHTQSPSRLPGIHQYFQHHLDPGQGGLFPWSEAFRDRSPEEPGFYGDAEITFASQSDLAAFAAALDPVTQDEQNVFDKTISYQATAANVATYVDRSVDDSPNGDLGVTEKYMLYLRKRNDVAIDEFRERVKRDVAPRVASDANVLKVGARLSRHTTTRASHSRRMSRTSRTERRRYKVVSRSPSPMPWPGAATGRQNQALRRFRLCLTSRKTSTR